MAAVDVAQRYFDAWNSRDPSAIVATFAKGGTYNDPTSGGTLRNCHEITRPLLHAQLYLMGDS